MRSSFRCMLLLGSAVALISMTAARADDPLAPEGTERPKMGKELILPPILNEAPPGSKIELPPPGQEHLLGKRPDGSIESASKVEARASEEPPAEPVSVAVSNEAEPVRETNKKQRKRKERAQAVAEAKAPARVADATPVAEASADKALYSNLKPTSAPDQSMVVAEGKTALSADDQPAAANAGIVQTSQRMGELAKPAMGGPELSGPPKPSDGMTNAPEPIRDGDTLTGRQEKLLARAEAKPEPKVNLNPGRMAKTEEKAESVKPVETAPANAPAIERFEIAQATAAPMPVTPGKAMRSADPDWRFAVSASAGYALVNTAKQRYQGGFSTSPAAGGARSIDLPVAQGRVTSDDEDDAVPLQLAIKANLEDLVEPLSIFGIGAAAKPWLRLSFGGHDASFRNSGTFAAAPTDGLQIANPAGGAFNILGAAGSASFRGDQKTRGGKVLYGQTTEGAQVNWTGFGGVEFVERRTRQRIAVTATGEGTAGSVFPGAPAQPFTGGYDTRLKSATTSFILGLAAEVGLDTAKRLTVDAYGHVSYDVTSARVNDSVALNNGFAGSARSRKTEQSAGYGAGLGINYAVTDAVKLRLGADYESHEAAPVVVRDGINPSRVDLEREDVLTGSLTATWKF